jgi:hypothetical protein
MSMLALFVMSKVCVERFLIVVVVVSYHLMCYECRNIIETATVTAIRLNDAKVLDWLKAKVIQTHVSILMLLLLMNNNDRYMHV